MTIATFFEQLALQLGIGRIKSHEERRNSKIIIVRRILQRQNLDPDLNAVWYLFCQVRNSAYHYWRLQDRWHIKSKHIDYIRSRAERISFDFQRQQLNNGDRPRLRANVEGWKHWDDVFEDFVKECGLSAANTEASSTD